MMPGGKLSREELEAVERDLYGVAVDRSAGDVPASDAESKADETEAAFDRDDLIRQIVERLEIEPGEEDVPEHLLGKPLGREFERMLLADMYATMFEFRLWADAYQRRGVLGMLGGKRRARRVSKEA